MINKKLLVIIISLISISFLIHSLPFFIMDKSSYNFYDTDSWYTIRQIELIKQNQPLNFDLLAEYPQGKSIDWGIFEAYLGYSLSYFSNNPIDIFNTSGFISPILLIIFSILIYYFISYLFNKEVGLYSFILMLFPTGFLMSQSIFGIIDHHLLECIFGTLLLLSLLIFIIKRKIFGLILYLFLCILSFLNSHETCLIFIGISIIIFTIDCIYQIVINKKYQWLIFIIEIIGVFLIFIYFNTELLRVINLIIGWNEPIAELQSLSIISFINHFGILLLIAELDLLLNKFKKENYSLLIYYLWLITLLLVFLSFKFIRNEIFLFPLIAIIASYYLTKFNLNWRKFLVILFIIFSIISTIGVNLTYLKTIEENKGWSNTFQYMNNLQENENSKIVLTWWDYGHWVLVAGKQISFTNPFQVRANQAALIFTQNKAESLKLIKQYNISYIIVSEKDKKNFNAMLYYANMKSDYNESYLKDLIESNSPIYENNGIKLFNI